jgi:hypothetical protein
MSPEMTTKDGASVPAIDLHVWGMSIERSTPSE